VETERVGAKKRLIIFAVIAFVIAWALFLSIPVSGMKYGTGLSIILVASAMFAPAIASILARLITKEGFKNMYLRPNIKGHIRAYLLIFFGPSILIFLSLALYFLIFPGKYDSNFATLQYLATLSGKGLTASNLLLISVLEVLIIGPIINIIPTLGEELGWRGYLLPKLRLFFSDRASLVITGAVWGIWHAPVIALGHNYGTNYTGYPYLGILMMVVFCIVLGIIEGYISIKLNSCIPAAMIHSTVNAGAALPLYLIKGSYNPLLGPTIAGLIGALPLIALAAVLLYKSSGKKPFGEAAPEASL